jgi:cbb3-type cytochrome oxidase subunit 3
MLEGFFFLFFFSLYLLTYPLRLYRRHKKSSFKHKSGVLYLLKEKPCPNLEYDYFGESTAEVDLDDEDS